MIYNNCLDYAEASNNEDAFNLITEFIEFEVPKMKDSSCGKFKVLAASDIYGLNKAIYEYLDNGCYVDSENDNYISKKIMLNANETVHGYIQKHF